MNRFRLISFGVAASLAASQSHAVLITEWDYRNDAGFLSFENTNENPAGITPSGLTALGVDYSGPLAFGPTLDGLPTGLSWGNGGDQSSLTLGSSTGVFGDEGRLDSVTPGGISGTVFTGGPAVDGVGVVHSNFAIPQGSETLGKAVVLDGLELSVAEPAAYGPLDFAAPTLAFGIYFEETFNGISSNCPYGDGNPACEDLFVITIPTEAEVSVDVDADTFEFSVDFRLDNDPTTELGQYEYTITTLLQGVDVIGFDANSEQCTNAGIAVDTECWGFLTEEGQDNYLAASYRITATDVTEPATLAVFGLSLLGLAGVRRRQA
ncbi:THxN family PEP-CTERM protein [Aliagarivorans marinus]|uniref:THxN family PEP-CTERM protein n=1 Tax=Aliagarivorans marinus TaxID=561965 RepID=UPI0004237C13|nr:THxN family PEP-CTERM protein [Aliagarivorans marinus]